MTSTEPRFEYVTVERRPVRDGFVEVVEGRPLRPRVKPRTMFRAVPAKGTRSHLLASERDAQRWLDECEIGGNLNGFLHELAGRKFRR